MKKLILFLFIVLAPFSVNAMAVSETFDVGDSISVALTENDTEIGKGFHVLRESKAGEETVTAIADGTVTDKRSDGLPVSPSIYDETMIGTHDATTVRENAYINNSLIEGTKSWRVVDRRLLTVEDLQALGIDKDIKKKYAWLSPLILSDALLPEDYNYWTQSAASDSTTDSPKVYCVTRNESATGSGEDVVYASLVSKSIGDPTNNPKCAVRPVIVVKKEYIICNNSKTTTKKPEQNVDTGVEDYFLPLGLITLITACGYFVVHSKNLFKNF